MTGPSGTRRAWLAPSAPPKGSPASAVPGRAGSSRVGRSKVRSPMAARSIDRMAPDRAYSGMKANSFDGAPLLVLPPWARNSRDAARSSTRPLPAWFSSERGSPRTRSVRRQPVAVPGEPGQHPGVGVQGKLEPRRAAAHAGIGRDGVDHRLLGGAGDLDAGQLPADHRRVLDPVVVVVRQVDQRPDRFAGGDPVRRRPAPLQRQGPDDPRLLPDIEPPVRPEPDGRHPGRVRALDHDPWRSGGPTSGAVRPGCPAQDNAPTATAPSARQPRRAARRPYDGGEPSDES